MSDLVSTIIPVFNRAAFLEEALTSVLAQSYRPIEVILVDDGSTDGTGELVDRLASENPGELTVIHTVNGGAGAARENGRQVARGTFIQYLDSDDILLPNKFSDQVGMLHKRSDCGAAYGVTRLIDERGGILEDPYKETGDGHDFLFPGLLRSRWWNTQTPLWRREVCDRIGPWSPMRMSEDWEYDARAGGMKVRLAHTRVPVCHTRRHTGQRLTKQGMTRDVLSDTARLLNVLHACASEAGVEATSPEMEYFARWCLLETRRCGAAGLTDEARHLYHLAKRASTATPGLRNKAALYGLLARLVGWKVTGKLSLAADRRSHTSQRSSR